MSGLKIWKRSWTTVFSGVTGAILSIEYLFSHWQLLAMHLLGLASLLCILFFFKKLQQNFRLSTELSLLEQEEHSP